MAELDIWRAAFEKLHARVIAVCDFDASESAPPQDKRWARTLADLATLAAALDYGIETATAAIRRPDGELIATSLLRQGATITITYDPGEPGRCNEDGDVVDEPYPAFYYADAYDPAGEQTAGGRSGTSPADALAHLTAIHDIGDAAGAYASGPPF